MSSGGKKVIGERYVGSCHWQLPLNPGICCMTYFLHITKNTREGRFDSGVITKGTMKIIMWNTTFFLNFVLKVDKHYYKPANACSVVPPTWHAAAPVLAVTNVLWGGSMLNKRFSRYDFPVPALPVKKTLFPAFTAFSTAICSTVRFVWKELKLLRRFRAGPFSPQSRPIVSWFSFPDVFILFGVRALLSSRGRFLLPEVHVKSLSVSGLTFSNDRGFSLKSRFLLQACPFCLLWLSFRDKHFKKAVNWFGGQFENMIWSLCVKSLIVAFPSCTNRLWMLISFRRKVFPNGDWLLTIRRAMSRNSSLPSTTLILL